MITMENNGRLSKETRADQALRVQLFAGVYGDDPVAARAALDSLRRLYRLRLPLVETRLGIGDAGVMNAAPTDARGVGARGIAPHQEAA